MLANSREAGLLTDWHLEGCFGHGGEAEFARRFAPEKLAQRQAKRVAAGVEPGIERRHYELVFPEGTFALPSELAGRSGVFYASSSTYLDGGGEWNVYLESGAEAVVFVDGRRVLARESHASPGNGRATGKDSSGKRLSLGAGEVHGAGSSVPGCDTAAELGIEAEEQYAVLEGFARVGRHAGRARDSALERFHGRRRGHRKLMPRGRAQTANAQCPK